MWGELAILCCKDDDSLKSKALKELQRAGVSNISTNKLMNFISKEDMIWTVTMHNGRKLKKYPEIESHRYKGIQNLNNRNSNLIQSVISLAWFKPFIRLKRSEVL